MPSWRVHRALALRASAGLPKEVVKGLLEGVVEPDVVADRKVICGHKRCRIVNVHHHAGVPWNLVKYYFNLACFYRARGNLYAAGRALGRALHYIHDGIVTRDNHDEIEREMDKLVEKLPDLCKNEVAVRSNKATNALCTAYLDSKRFIEWFIMEPQHTQKKALRVLWLGWMKKWWLATIFAFVFPLVPSPLLIIIFLIALSLTLIWFSTASTQELEKYVIAMRRGET